MADDAMDAITTLFRTIVETQRETVTVLREFQEDIASVTDRLERLEEHLGAKREPPPEFPEPSE